MPSLLVFQCPQEKLNLLLLHTQMKSVNRALCSELEKVHRQCTCCQYDGLESIHNLIPLEKRSCQGIEGRVRCPLPELPGLVKTTNSREMHSCRNIYFHAYTLSVCRFFEKIQCTASHIRARTCCTRKTISFARSIETSLLKLKISTALNLSTRSRPVLA